MDLSDSFRVRFMTRVGIIGIGRIGPIDTDGADLGNPIFTYHDAPACGMRVELVDQARRAAFYESLGRTIPAGE